MKRWKKLRMFFEECERLYFPSSHKSTGGIAACKWVQSYKSQVNLISEIFINAWTFTSRRLSPVPVSNSTVWFIWRTNLRSKMNTSVSGDLTSITELSGELAATSLQCKIILVSASSCEEHNFSTSSETTFFPSILFKMMHSLPLMKTKCFSCSFGAYFLFFHSSKRKLHKRFCFLHYELFSTTRNFSGRSFH